MAKAYISTSGHVLADPMALATHAMNMWLDYARIWPSSWMKMLGQDVKPVAVPDQERRAFQRRRDGLTISCSTSSSSPT